MGDAKMLLESLRDLGVFESGDDSYSVVEVKKGVSFEIVKNGLVAYNVDKHGSKFACTCPGFKYRGKCRHLEMVEKILPPPPQRHPRAKIVALLPKIKKMFAPIGNWEIAGSFRRGLSDSKDIDILIETNPGGFKKALDVLQAEPTYKQVMAGPDIIRGYIEGIEFDLTRVNAAEYVFYLLYRTGSKEENLMMRSTAKSKGYKLNEHGLFDPSGKKVNCETEKDIYTALGLVYHEPWNRKGKKEIL